MYISGCYGHIPHMPSRNVLRKLIKFPESISKRNENFIVEMNRCESVSVHVRRTDYLLACNNAPSTFSWWGAFLGEENGVVVYPDPWFRDVVNPRTCVPKDWYALSF